MKITNNLKKAAITSGCTVAGWVLAKAAKAKPENVPPYTVLGAFVGVVVAEYFIQEEQEKPKLLKAKK